MKIRCLLILLLIAGIILALTGPLYAERKDSFLGRIIDSVKDGAEVVRQDVENYNTFIIKLSIINTTSQSWSVQVWQEGDEAGPEFERQIGPRESRAWSFETVAYLGQRNYQIIYRKGKSTVDGVNFDPSKKDRVTDRI